MNKKMLPEIMKVLFTANFRNTPKNLDEDMIKLWYQYFQNYDENLFIEKIYEYIADNSFFPTINDLLKLMEVTDKYYNPDEVYEKYMKGTDDELIKKAINKAGYSQYYLSNLTADTIERYAKPNIKRVYKVLIAEKQKEKNLLKIKQICNDVKLLGGLKWE